MNLVSNRAAEPAPFGHYQIPFRSMALVSPHLVGLGSMCLFDFVTSLAKEVGPPLYLIYAHKSRIVDRDCVMDDE